MSRVRLLSVPLVGVAAIIIACEAIAETSVTPDINAPLATIQALIEGTLTLANEGRVPLRLVPDAADVSEWRQRR